MCIMDKKKLGLQAMLRMESKDKLHGPHSVKELMDLSLKIAVPKMPCRNRYKSDTIMLVFKYLTMR